MSWDLVGVAVLVGAATLYITVLGTRKVREMLHAARTPGPTRCGGCTLCPGHEDAACCDPRPGGPRV
ncbi:MAG: hypothetical protein H6678_03995 [Candidatus Delongbacteria bacterium]|nr:hypothetical protein [Candidatus Cloacimonadota bacterium]MCA9787682.1 hypothetical protein [Candidatus Cloacimonadota bacterium]MCB9472957.1 hypothetical protein [Candidatus Delongbacteria bacterium]